MNHWPPILALLPLLPLIAGDWATTYRLIAERVNALLKQVTDFRGGSNDNVRNFGAGYVAYGGLDNSLQGSVQLEFGTNLPNPAGLNGPALLIGSGGGSFTGSITGTVLTVSATAAGASIGAGQLITGAGVGPGTGIVSLGTGTGGAGTYNLNVSQTVGSEAMDASAAAWILTDQAFHNSTPGNFLGVIAGETQGAGTAPGGMLFLAGGGSFGGFGGPLQAQGGTSANARAGDGVLQGGSATGATGAAVPGNAVVSGGQVGKVGANVLLIATLPPGATGPGDVRVQLNSTILMQFLSNGEIYLTASGTGAGLAGQALVSQGPGAPAKWLTAFTGDIPAGHITHVASGLITGFT